MKLMEMPVGKLTGERLIRFNYVHILVELFSLMAFCSLSLLHTCADFMLGP